MSRYIATRAIRGANALVTEAELMLESSIDGKRTGNSGRFPKHCLLPPGDRWDDWCTG